MIRASCDALVAGIDSPLLRELAGVSFDDPTHDVEELLPGTCDELRVPYYERGSVAGQVAAARVRARQCASGDLSPREFVAWVHETFGHQNDLLEPFSSLDDEYDTMAYKGLTEAQIDEMVRDAAAQLGD